MLFDVQMRWNEQGRSSPDELWDLKIQEIEHAQTTIADGIVRGATRSSRSRSSREDG